MGHPKTHGKPRERSKRARKLLRHKSNQLAAIKAAGANLAREHQKTMLWLLAVLKTTGGAVVTQAELLGVQAQFGRLGWQAVPDAQPPTHWVIRVVDSAATADSAPEGAAEETPVWGVDGEAATETPEDGGSDRDDVPAAPTAP